MTGMNSAGGINAYNTYLNSTNQKTRQKENKDSVLDATKKESASGIKDSDYGKTIGKPELSDKAKDYYEQLKKKYGNYDFVLVSSDEIDKVKANASKYANGFKTVVLIDEDKIEKMATDDKFRQKYEGILDGASKQLEQMKNSMLSQGANVKGFGIQVNKDGTTSFFAVLKKSSADQKARIEKKREQAKIDRAKAKEKSDKAAKEEKIKEKTKEKKEIEDDTVTFTADSMEELLQKVSDFAFDERSNAVRTDDERMLGQSIDFRG